MSTRAPRPAWVARPLNPRRAWAIFAVSLAVALLVGVVMGQYAKARLTEARQGDLLGTSRVGEWADMSEYGIRIRLDDVAIAESFPGRYGSESAALEGLLLARVRMSVIATVDIAETGQEILTCDLGLLTAAGERYWPSGPMLEGPEYSNCGAVPKPITAGQEFEIQQVFQIRPSDAAGLVVEVTGSDLRPQAGGTWPVWRIETQ